MSIKIYSKFIVVGVISIILNYGLYYLLCTETSINYIIASVIGYFLGFTVGFFLNNNWTFAYRKFSAEKILGYCIVYFFSLCISSFLLWIMVSQLHFPVLMANLVSIGISTVCNFSGLNYIIYSKSILPDGTTIISNSIFELKKDKGEKL